MVKTLRITVKGKVQGVTYRESARETALRLGVTGKVRNLENGDVEMVVTGESQVLDELISWCYQGPPRAEVDSVTWEERTAEHFNGFTVIRSRDSNN
jgi:acylphosphatase